MADGDPPGGARAAETPAWRVTTSSNPPYDAADAACGPQSRRAGSITRHGAADDASSWLTYGVPAVIGRVRAPGTLPGVQVFCLVFLPFALGHYISSLLRNVNAILAPQLMAELALTPAQLGLLTSA